ncbi:MAG: EamA family transporter RarD [Chloroflexota bacterium]|nr:MAG: EamA family transporter RarD [Chloroflexota bacterium]
MNKGVLFGIGAYLMWGFFPIYFKALHQVPPLQIMMHRIVWSFLFVIFIILIRKQWSRFVDSLRQPRILLTYTVTAFLLAVNWLIYIYGINSDQVVETSLGYFINPLLSVALGVIFLHERLRAMQWVPVALVGFGVIYLTLQYGEPPWIALALAFSFGVYGLLKKIAPLGALQGLSLETGIIFFPAVIYLLYAEFQGSGAFGHLGWQSNFLLAFVGVITALPLLFFGLAARSIPLTLLGILQYIAPTVQFLLGVFLYDEPFTINRLIGFAIIWLALIIFTVEGLQQRRKSAAAAIPT